MLELGVGADILRAFGWFYIGLMALSIVTAVWLPQRWWRKAIAGTAVLLVFVGPAYKREKEGAQLLAEKRLRYEQAKALFEERCKSAEEKIYRKVEGVEGVLLLNLRSNDKFRNEANENWPDAGLANEFSGESYIANFLQWEVRRDKRVPLGALSARPTDYPGYRYVDAKDEEGVMWRYTFQKSDDMGNHKVAKVKLSGPPARYAVQFTNLIDPEDRKLWVAGTTVKVLDTQTMEELARSTWYSFEPGQGSTAGGRQPWRFARSCPELRAGLERAPTRFFLNRVLTPKTVE